MGCYTIVVVDTRDTYTCIADRAVLTLDVSGLDASAAQALHMQSMRINTPDTWLDIACHRVAMKLEEGGGP